eukprot:1638212-Rhodomonas_salina.4
MSDGWFRCWVRWFATSYFHPVTATPLLDLESASELMDRVACRWGRVLWATTLQAQWLTRSSGATHVLWGVNASLRVESWSDGNGRFEREE